MTEQSTETQSLPQLLQALPKAEQWVKGLQVGCSLSGNPLPLGFSSSSAPGTFEHNGDNPFRLEWKWQTAPQQSKTWISPNGFCLSAGEEAYVCGFAYQPGLWIGFYQNSAIPHLFSPNHLVAKEENEERFSTEDQHIALHRDGNGFYYIQYAESGSAPAREEAEQALQTFLHERVMLQQKVSRGSGFPSLWNNEKFFSQARNANSDFSHIHYPRYHNESEFISCNEFFPLISFWATRDNKKAIDLFDGALWITKNLTFLPQQYDIQKQNALGSARAIAMLAQAANTILPHSEDSEAFLKERLPALGDWLKQEIIHFGQKEEPSITQSSLLCNEIEQFLQLAQTARSANDMQGHFYQHYENFLGQLEVKIKKSKGTKELNEPVAFLEHYSPLLLHEIHPAIQKKLTGTIAATLSKLNFNKMLPSQFYLIRSILKNQQLSHLISSLHAGYHNHLNQQLGNPTQTPKNIREESAARAIFLALGTNSSGETLAARAPTSKTEQWLNRHRKGIVTTLLLSLVTAVLGLNFWSQRKKTLTPTQLYALSGLAEHNYKTGDYDESMNLLDTLREKTAVPATKAHFAYMAAKNHYAKGNFAEAEKQFQEAIDTGHTAPQALWNVAHCQYKQKKYAAAQKTFLEFSKKYKQDYPQLVTRAYLAMELVRAEERRAKVN